MPDPSVWRGAGPLVLASASAARKGLLDAAGLPVETEVSGVDERAIEDAMPAGATPREVAARLALEKALAVSRRRPEAFVIGADQVLACEGELFAKAPDAAAARARLGRLAGRIHHLHSAAALLREGRVLWEGADSAELAMRALDPEAIAAYVALAGEAATRSVGCYEIEGLGLHLFEDVRGSHATILGLPLGPLVAGLRRLGLTAF